MSKRNSSAYRSRISSRADLAYVRLRNACELAVYEISAAHVLVVDKVGNDHIEIRTTKRRPAWLTQSRRLTRHEAERRIRTSATIKAEWKAVYLQMLAAGAGTQGGK